MGRLNYANRKTEGLKLGQSIAKDLIKRIPPGTASKSALRDPIVELDVTGRALASHGFQELADALTSSLEYDGENGRVLLLEEVCLKANKLNASCLPALARIIKLAAHELRDLDLSDNNITITSTPDAEAWEGFLEAFAECCVLRRLDLSGNALGSKAMELLAKVYSREPTIDLMLEEDTETTLESGTPSRRGTIDETQVLSRQTRNLSLSSASHTYSEEDEDEQTTMQDHKVAHGVGHDAKSPGKYQGQASHSNLSPIYSSTRGLRSIPYVILTNTGMTDDGALHLSYVLACHHPPHRLLKQVPPPRPGHQVQLLDAYDNETGCQGIIYLPNDHISGPGHRILEMCESARQFLLDENRPAQSPEYSQSHFRRTSSSRKNSVTHSSPSVSASGSRRRSGTKGEYEELTGCEAVYAELDRARSRIQGNTLKDVGVQSNDLWRTTLEMLGTCRLLCPIRKEEVRASKPVEDSFSSLQPVKNAEFPVLPKTRSKPFVGYLDPWAPMLAPKSPNIPATPQTKKQELKIKTTASSPLGGATTSPTAVSPKTGALQTIPYRSDLPHGLPEQAWARIMGHHVGADKYMSQNQQRNVLRWAVNRKTLAKEMESLGKPESAQIWKALEGMGCLAYEGDA